MLRQLIPVFVLTCTLQATSLGVISRSEAKDLTDVLGRAFVFQSPTGEFDASGEISSLVDFSHISKAVGPAFSSAVARSVAQEFPLVSVAPAFIYHFNPSTDIYERLTGVPGPLFSERALTIGKGQFNFGVGYSFINYSSINGVSLDNIQSPGLISEFFDEKRRIKEHLPTGENLFVIPLTLSRIRTLIDLNAHVVVPTFRYGVTDRWDVSLALPIVSTYLRVRNRAVRTEDLATFAKEGPEGDFRDFVDRTGKPIEGDLLRFSKSERPSASLSKASGSATGVGDFLLRAKYQFWQNGFGGGALGLHLQFPTGKVRDFHGTGQTHVITFLYLSQVLRELFEPHLNLGIDFNADNVNQSSFLYAVGATLRVGKKLGLVIDFLGRSEFQRLQVRINPNDTVKGAVLDRALNTCTTEKPCFIKQDNISFPALPIRFKRNEIVNFSFGLRYALGTAGSVFFGGIVPLNDDGFRANFIPSGGVEYTF